MNRVLALCAIILVACGDKGSGPEDDPVSKVREGRFFGHDRTVGQEARCLLGSPTWASIRGTDGNTYVNLRGTVSLSGETASLLVQFRIMGRSFEMNAIEANGTPLDRATAEAFVAAMGDCG